MISFRKFLIESFLIENRAWHGFIKQYGQDLLRKAGLDREYEKLRDQIDHGSPEHLTNFLSDKLGMKDLTPEEGRWIFKNFHRGGIHRAEDIKATAIPALLELRKAKSAGHSKVDLSSITSSADLNSHLNKISPERALKNYNLSPEEYTVHGSNEHWTLIQPHTKNSACALGRGSNWCTASSGQGNLFEKYNKHHQGIFILIPKEPSHQNEKYQFSGHPDGGLSQFMDVNDHEVGTDNSPNFKERPLPQIDQKNTHLSRLLNHIKIRDLSSTLTPYNFKNDDVTELFNSNSYEKIKELIKPRYWTRDHTNHLLDLIHNRVKHVASLNNYEDFIGDQDAGLSELMTHLDRVDVNHEELEPIAKTTFEVKGQFFPKLQHSIATHSAFDPFIDKPSPHERYNSLSFFLANHNSSELNQKKRDETHEKLINHVKYNPSRIDEPTIDLMLSYVNNTGDESNHNRELVETLMKHPEFNLKHATSFFDERGNSLWRDNHRIPDFLLPRMQDKIKNWMDVNVRPEEIHEIMDKLEKPSIPNVHVPKHEPNIQNIAYNAILHGGDSVTPDVLERGINHSNERVRLASMQRLVDGTRFMAGKDQPSPVWGLEPEHRAKLMRQAINNGNLDAHMVFANGINLNHHHGPEPGEGNEEKDYSHIFSPVIDHFIQTVKSSNYKTQQRAMIFNSLLSNNKDTKNSTLTPKQEEEIKSFVSENRNE